MENEIVKIDPGALVGNARNVAGACKEIVTRTAIEIDNRKYVRCEGWQAIAIAHGCVLSARDVEQVDGGVRAIGEVRRVSDGVVIATGEGFVGNDEPRWAQAAEYARRSMAQTRAMSRAARSAFAHIVVLMDSNLQTTPAEEVPENGFARSVERGADNGIGIKNVIDEVQRRIKENEDLDALTADVEAARSGITEKQYKYAHSLIKKAREQEVF